MRKNLLEIHDSANRNETELVSRLLWNTSMVPRVRSLVSSEDMLKHARAYDVIVDSFIRDRDVMFEFSKAGFMASSFSIENDTLRPIEAVCSDIKANASAARLFSVLEVALCTVDPKNVAQLAAETQKGIVSSVSISETESSDAASVIATFLDRQQFYRNKFLSGGGIIGIPCGYPKIDDVIDGIRPEHLWVIGGYTNFGKSSLALNVTANLIRQGKRVVFYSLEMSKVDILTKLVGIMTSQPGLSIIKGYRHDEEKVRMAFDMISKSNFSIHSSKCELDAIEYSMYDENMKAPVDLFIVDFIQLVTVKDARSEYETITGAVLGMQRSAKALKSTIVILSQISNDGARSPNDSVMSFKGSGAIAAAADLAIEIGMGEDDKEEWKRKLYEGEKVRMKLNVRKNRHGRTGVVEVDFLGSTGVFEQADDFKDFKQAALPVKPKRMPGDY